MRNNETKVEKDYLHDEVVKLGGITYKWVSPGRSGVPDRIVLIKGFVFFIEVKTFNGHLEDHQAREIKRLRDQGQDARVIYGKKGVREFLEEVRKL